MAHFLVELKGLIFVLTRFPDTVKAPCGQLHNTGDRRGHINGTGGLCYCHSTVHRAGNVTSWLEKYIVIRPASMYKEEIGFLLHTQP